MQRYLRAEGSTTSFINIGRSFRWDESNDVKISQIRENQIFSYTTYDQETFPNPDCDHFMGTIAMR